MVKLVFFKLNSGNFNDGFTVNLRIGESGSYSPGEVNAQLPPEPNIAELYNRWQFYYLNLERHFRGRERRGSRIDDVGQIREQCRQLSQKLRETFRNWLKRSENANFRELRERLREEIRDSKERQEEVTVFIQTEDDLLKRLPWSEWDLLYEYRKTEIILSPLEYQGVSKVKSSTSQNKVKILAILGNSDGIEIQVDSNFLKSLPDVDPLFLPEPQRAQLSDRLWEQSWDILFFAGHSSSQGESGEIYINKIDSLTVPDLKNGLIKAIESGLQLAIFNSCDGLKLAEDLVSLKIPQVIVMREPVPDLVAQQFLKHFLTAFSGGNSLYLAVREARERLCTEGWDDKFPGSISLPIICQNPAVEPPTWQGFLRKIPPAWKLKHTLTGHSETVESIAISPDGKIIASGSLDHTIKLWNLETGELLNTLTGHTSTVLSLAFSQDGKTLASASNMAFQDGTIKLWDADTGRVKQTLGNSLLALRVSCIAFSPDGQFLASGHIDTTIKLWHLGTGKVRHTLRGHGWDVRTIAFSKHDNILLSGGMDGAIAIWNWYTGERLHTLNRPTDLVGSLVSWFDSSIGSIWSIAISPDGQIIASSSSSQPIALWNTKTGKQLRILTEHSGAVYSVTFSPDGKTLASGGEDNTIRIWNFYTGELLDTLRHSGPVKSIAFSLDRQNLVSGSADSTIKVWHLSS